MTNFDLYQTGRRHGGGDSLRALLLVLGTVIVGILFTAAVPDETWHDLAAQSASENWHGNVASHGAE